MKTEATTLNKPEKAIVPAPTPDFFESMRREMEDFWERPLPFLFRPLGRRMRKLGKAMSAWTPNIDAFEKDNELWVRADLPGLKKENVQVHLEEGDLVIRGERREEKEMKEENFFCAESHYGTFYRRMALPFEADPKRMVAKFTDGVLEVRIAIPKGHQPETLTIPVA